MIANASSSEKGGTSSCTHHNTMRDSASSIANTIVLPASFDGFIAVVSMSLQPGLAAMLLQYQ
jgi:hypothetical protein